MLSEKFLAEIRAEIAERESELEEWRELERLTARLGSEGPRPARGEESTPPNPSERAPHAASRRVDAGHPARRPRGKPAERRQAILEALSAKGPLSPRALAKIVGADVRDDLRVLRDAGKVIASGTTSSRTYDVARPASAKESNGHGHESRVARLRAARDQAIGAAGGKEEPALEDQVVEILRDVGGRVKLEDISYQLRKWRREFTPSELDQAASRLVTHGLAIADDGGGLRLSELFAERPLEDAILDAAGVDSL